MDDTNRRFANIRQGLDDAPPHLFKAERELREEIGNAVDALAALARDLIKARPCSCDGVHNVEAVIWAWLTRGTDAGATLEGIGKYGIPSWSNLGANPPDRAA